MNELLETRSRMRFALLILSLYTVAPAANAAEHLGNVFLAGDDICVNVPKD